MREKYDGKLLLKNNDNENRTVFSLCNISYKFFSHLTMETH